MAKRKFGHKVTSPTTQANRIPVDSDISEEVEKRLRELEYEHEAQRRVWKIALVVVSFCGAGATVIAAVVQIILSLVKG